MSNVTYFEVAFEFTLSLAGQNMDTTVTKVLISWATFSVLLIWMNELFICWKVEKDLDIVEFVTYAYFPPYASDSIEKHVGALLVYRKFQLA